MLTIQAGIGIGLVVLLAILANQRAGNDLREMPQKAQRAFCVSVFAAGCLMRLWQLGSLPAGLSAEEALVGVQAKALWQTGGFLFDGRLTTQFVQWTGESAGPLLSVLTAPFVGVFGMNTLAVRMPLALLSCAAMPAVYDIGRQASGKHMGRWCLTLYALCPYFVLTARMTTSAQAAVCLLPIVVCCLLRGLQKTGMLCVGSLLMGLMAYAQDMFFFIAPAAILLAMGMAMLGGMKKLTALCAALPGLLLCVPALLTLYVNLTGREGFTLLNLIEIPQLEAFDKAEMLFAEQTAGNLLEYTLRRIWTVITGGFFQLVSHENASTALFAPSGMGTMYLMSIPLLLLGLFDGLNGLLSGRHVSAEKHQKKLLIIGLFVLTLIFLTLYGSKGVEDLSGCTSMYDDSALFLFAVLLTAAGLSQIERKSTACAAGMQGLYAVCAVMLCFHLFGGSYTAESNIYMDGFEAMAHRAGEIQEQTGKKVVVTSSVYPHRMPDQAAEMLYLFGADVDMKAAAQMQGGMYEVVYMPSIEMPDSKDIYLIEQNDVPHWDYEGFIYEEAGQYALIYAPIAE